MEFNFAEKFRQSIEKLKAQEVKLNDPEATQEIKLPLQDQKLYTIWKRSSSDSIKKKVMWGQPLKEAMNAMACFHAKNLYENGELILVYYELLLDGEIPSKELSFDEVVFRGKMSHKKEKQFDFPTDCVKMIQSY